MEQKRLANEIQRCLMNFLKGGYDVLLPNFFFGWNECDLFRINQKDFVFEYEIKISRQDFFNDVKKQSRDSSKYKLLLDATNEYCPNRFFYVVPEGLIKIEEVPKFAGLLYSIGGYFDVVKNAPLLHKRPIGFNIYRDVCRTLSTRDFEYRKKLRKLNVGDYEREIAALKREVNSLKETNREFRNELFCRKHGIKND